MVLFMVCSRGHYHEHMIQCALESLTGIPGTKGTGLGVGVLLLFVGALIVAVVGCQKGS